MSVVDDPPLDVRKRKQAQAAPDVVLVNSVGSRVTIEAVAVTTTGVPVRISIAVTVLVVRVGMTVSPVVAVLIRIPVFGVGRVTVLGLVRAILAIGVRLG